MGGGLVICELMDVVLVLFGGLFFLGGCSGAEGGRENGHPITPAMLDPHISRTLPHRETSLHIEAGDPRNPRTVE